MLGFYDYGELHDKTRKGLKRYLTKKETEYHYHMQYIDGQLGKKYQAKPEANFCVSKI